METVKQPTIDIEKAYSALYKLDLLQSMAKQFDNKEYPIIEYAFLLDVLVEQLKESLNY